MEQEKKNVSWGSIGIIIAILVLAGSIFFTGMRISNTVNTNIQEIRDKVREEIKTDLRTEVISFMHAFRASSMANRQVSTEDIEKGYEFAEKLLSRMK